MSEKWDEDKYPGFSKRTSLLGLVFALGMLVLILRLWHLQIIKGEEYTAQSDSNRLRPLRLAAPRGVIYGRDGMRDNVILADNRAARDLKFVLADCTTEPKKVANYLEKILQIDRELFLSEVENARKTKQPHRSILIKQDIPRSVSARIEEMAPFLPGVFTVVRPVRRYTYGRTGGQILGYLGEIDKKALEASKEKENKRDRYNMGDLIGRSGVERQYESSLHGIDGEMLFTKFATGVPQLRTDTYGNLYVENDNYGHRLNVEREAEDPVSGNDVHLTLDIGLQAKAEELLKGEEGAIVVLNADTGAVLALASVPGYDPSVFVSPQGTSQRAEILTGKPNRMINRAYQEVYAPGSTYKILLASAALEEGVVDKNTTYYCPGKFRLPGVNRPWHCWKRSGHGNIAVVDAIAFSCDVFFYNVGRLLEVDRIKEWSTKFGWGEKTGFDLPGEVAGLIPDPTWKRSVYKNLVPDDPSEWNWYPGETVNLSIGQGSCAATPLQCALLMATITNGGYKVTPFLDAEKLKGDQDGIIKKTKIISESTIAIIQEGMLKCVEKGSPAPTGTGRRAAIDGFRIMGKTGSAQMVSLSKHKDYATEEDIPKELRDHAWFMSGVMEQDERIAICILVEHGHHGSSAASPLAKEIIQYFYDSRRQDDSKVMVAKDANEGTSQ